MRYQHLRFPGGCGKAVTLSYDDGCRSDIRFSKIISQYGLKCTFNLCSANGAMSPTEIQENILDKGHEIAVHGLCHRAEGAVRPIEAIQDVLNCRLDLEKKFNTIVRGMAYPDTGITRLANGVTYERIKDYLSDLDIVYARTAGVDNQSFQLPNDWHRWVPTAHHSDAELFHYIENFLKKDPNNGYSASRFPLLFYLWGHSSEFERDGNWDLLDQICKKIAGHEDIWYATNMEIFEYVSAYEALQYSADGKIIYNPTLIRVWFELDKKLYSIASGERLNLHELL